VHAFAVEAARAWRHYHAHSLSQVSLSPICPLFAHAACSPCAASEGVAIACSPARSVTHRVEGKTLPMPRHAVMLMRSCQTRDAREMLRRQYACPCCRATACHKRRVRVHAARSVRSRADAEGMPERRARHAR